MNSSINSSVRSKKKREVSWAESFISAIIGDNYDDVMKHVEAEKIAKKLGTVKLYCYYMNFEWKDGKNRKISNSTCRKQLLKIMIIDIFRIDMIHQMSKCLSKNVFERNCFDSSRKNEKIIFSKATLRKLNEMMEFFLLKSEKYIIKMQFD